MPENRIQKKHVYDLHNAPLLHAAYNLLIPATIELSLDAFTA